MRTWRILAALSDSLWAVQGEMEDPGHRDWVKFTDVTFLFPPFSSHPASAPPLLLHPPASRLDQGAVRMTSCVSSNMEWMWNMEWRV